MKTHVIFVVLFFIFCSNSFSQDLKVKTPNSSKFYTADEKGIVKGDFTGSITKLTLSLTENPSKSYTVEFRGNNKGLFTSDGKEYVIDFQENILDHQIDYISGTETRSFKLENETNGNPKSENDAMKFTSSDKFKELFPQINITNHGIKILDQTNSNTQYKGKDYVHLFFDLNGNSIISTIPQGLSNVQYVVHIFYLTDKDNPHRIDYSVNQTKGSFDGTIIFNNTGKLDELELRAGDLKKNGAQYAWVHKEILLSTSTSDIQFEIHRNIIKKSNDLFDIEKSTLNTYTISMSPVYHGTFEVGLVNSTLSNPSYELVESSDNADEKVVKKGNDSNRGYITAMATFYTSPIIILEKLFGADIPNYKLTGRNFLEDHKIYERIYPSIGVSLNDKSFENLFFGLTWEFARGGSIWSGFQYGKVNTFDEPDGYEFGKTVTTDAEFKLRKDTDWKTNFAIGVNLDIKLVTDLFK